MIRTPALASIGMCFWNRRKAAMKSRQSTLIGVWIGLPILLYGVHQTTCANDIDVRESQLFLDDGVIESSTLVQRILHQPIRHPANPLLAPEEPWEGTTMNYLSGVFRDEESGLFRVWYVGVVNGGVPEMSKVFYPICTATSRDGIHWQRPKLEHYSHLTGGPNNIVLHLDKGCIAAPSIIHEPEDKDAPWKLLIHHSTRAPCHYFVRLATSLDGIHWKWKTTAKDQVYARLHDRMTAMLDRSHPDFPYLLFGRPALSADYPLLYPGRIHQREVFQTRLSSDGKKLSGLPTITLRPDLEDPPEAEFYHMSAFRYASLYIGTLMIYRVEQPPSAEVQLVTSRNMQDWHRVRPRLPFIQGSLPAGRQQGVWDAAGVQPQLSPPLLHDGALYFYYYGGPAFHGSRFLKGRFQLGLAQLRPDGFASLRSTWREGVLTTKPFRWPGGKLVVNGQELGGSRTSQAFLRVAVLDEDGHEITNYTNSQSEVLAGDFLVGVPSWSGKPQDMDPLIGQTIRLRFSFKQTEIFSFRSVMPD
jgi:hypothetical protein